MHSCFYSTALCRPYELKMADKLWQGVTSSLTWMTTSSGVTDRDFPGMLAVIQEQAWSLWNDYLEPEFGFSKNTFKDILWPSGFHLHYRDRDCSI